jgi:hypothetical protein
MITNLSLNFLVRVWRLYNFKHWIIWHSTWVILRLELKTGLLNLSLSDCGLTRLNTTLQNSRFSFVPLRHLIPLTLIMVCVWLLWLILVSVNQTAKFVNFLILRIYLREALLVHVCWSGGWNSWWDMVLLNIWSICGRSVVHDVIVVVLLDLFWLNDGNLFSRIGYAWLSSSSACTGHLRFTFWRMLLVVRLLLLIVWVHLRRHGFNRVVSRCHHSWLDARILSLD